MDRLGEIKERYESFSSSDDNYNVVRPSFILPVLIDDGYGREWSELAAYAKEDVPWLLKEVERLTDELNSIGDLD